MIESHIERGLHLYAKGTIERFGAYLTRSERAALEGRAAAIPSPLPASASEAPSAGTRIGVRMIGAIEIALPGEEPNRPRGVRLRTLLGLMVADLMLEAPLSQREFCRLAAGEAQEFEDARKTVNLAVHRLREIVGHEAIVTDRETPRLNLDLLDVDLLRAHRLLDEAESALREGSFNRAFAPLTGALDITHGEVILPTLYDEFFEAVREDFENRIRSVIIRAAKGLLRDGDAAGAEGVLRRAFAAMPEDEELAMILAETLTQLGKRTEARRVRLQAETLAG
jgi:DNA-binding SARP family transcriptional activator